MNVPVIKCNCGEIFSIDLQDDIPKMARKETKFRSLHSKHSIKNKNKKMPEFNIKRRTK